jgi:hypothetical protein
MAIRRLLMSLRRGEIMTDTDNNMVGIVVDAIRESFVIAAIKDIMLILVIRNITAGSASMTMAAITDSIKMAGTTTDVIMDVVMTVEKITEGVATKGTEMINMTMDREMANMAMAMAMAMATVINRIKKN